MNPFSITQVDSPRRVGPIVESLNRGALDSVLAAFAKLDQAVPHPPQRAPRIVRIQSHRAGLGKSHLLGRLFKAIDAKATLIYLLPFEDPKMAWVSILDTVVEELRRPEALGSREELITADQLDAFAHGIFGHALAELVKTGRASIAGMTDAVSVLQSGIGPKWDLTIDGLPLSHAFHASFGEMEVFLERQIDFLQRDQPIRIRNLCPLLRILYAYASSRQNYRRRKQCAMWLRGTPFETEESFQELGLQASDLVNPAVEAQAQEQAAKQRIVDLGILASFYRPFLFCFDQVEYFVENEAAAKRFGEILHFLSVYVPNHCTVFTTNSVVWDRLKLRFEEAYLDSIQPDPPVEIHGMNQAQGEELIHLRMNGEPPEKKSKLLEPAWLKSVFEVGNIGARDFLQRCEKRYDGIDGAPGQESLESLFQKKLWQLSVLRQNVLRYDQDLLKWSCEVVFPAAIPNCRARAFSSTRDYFPLIWEIGSRIIVFGFEPGNHHSRWGARLDEGLRLHRERSIEAIHLQTPQCSKVPPSSWRRSREFERHADHFRIVPLTFDELAFLHAARQLSLETSDGTIPYTSQEVVDYAKVHVRELCDRLIGKQRSTHDLSLGNSSTVDGAAVDGLSGTILGVVRECLFISLDMLRRKVETRHGATTESTILATCHDLEHVEIHSAGPQVILHYVK